MTVFQTAKQISPADVARKLGLKEKHGRFCCPFHDDNDPSMACYEDSRRFYCFSCHAKGDATDLWAKVTDTPAKVAAEAVCDAFGLKYSLCNDSDWRSRPAPVRRPAPAESREERARRQRIDDVAQLPQAVWQDWQRGMVLIMREEFEACARLFEVSPDPQGWLWRYAAERASRLRDEMDRLQDIEPKDLAAEVAARRADPARYPGQPVTSEALLRLILDDRLRLASMRLDEQESAYVFRTLQIAPQAGEAVTGC